MLTDRDHSVKRGAWKCRVYCPKDNKDTEAVLRSNYTGLLCLRTQTHTHVHTIVHKDTNTRQHINTHIVGSDSVSTITPLNDDSPPTQEH